MYTTKKCYTLSALYIIDTKFYFNVQLSFNRGRLRQCCGTRGSVLVEVFLSAEFICCVDGLVLKFFGLASYCLASQISVETLCVLEFLNNQV